jgi:hypothetical protein
MGGLVGIHGEVQMGGGHSHAVLHSAQHGGGLKRWVKGHSGTHIRVQPFHYNPIRSSKRWVALWASKNTSK